jgi:hypothetical protein
MLESEEVVAECEEMPASSPTTLDKAAELSNRLLAAHMAAMKTRMKGERRKRFLRHMAAFWPVPLGLMMSFYAPMLHDLAATWGPWAATLIFSLSALTGQDLSRGTGQAIFQALLYAQFPLDGLLAYMLLRRRFSLLSVCGQVTCLHVLAMLCLGLASGSLSRFLTN